MLTYIFVVSYFKVEVFYFIDLKPKMLLLRKFFILT